MEPHEAILETAALAIRACAEDKFQPKGNEYSAIFHAIDEAISIAKNRYPDSGEWLENVGDCMFDWEHLDIALGLGTIPRREDYQEECWRIARELEQAGMNAPSAAGVIPSPAE